jgi:uncharacterized RDD family membrane protein YckC
MSNPYEAPTFDQSDDLKKASHPLAPASQGKRFLNMIIDQLALYGLNVMLQTALAAAFMASREEITVQEAGVAQVILTLIGFLFSFAYFVILEAATGRTLGKLLTGTKVVDLSGGQPSVGQVLGRSLCRYIPFEAFSFFFGDSSHPIGWHDSIPKTRVVNVKVDNVK